MSSVVSRSVRLLAAVLWLGAIPIEAATIYVGEGDSLQAALNAAQPGDTVVLAQGVEFVGTFVLPFKPGADWITVRSSAPDAMLPGPGVRIHPAHAPLLARLRSSMLDTPALRTAPGAHHWDIRYLEFAANPSGTGDVIQLGDGLSAQFAPEQVPHHIVLNHVYVHGDRFIGQKRCIALHAADVTISDSYVSDCKSATQDSQAICGWNGPGPFTIENNYLEAAGENVMFGGSDPSIADLVPSNITFRGNHVSRPMSWRDPIVPTPEGVSAAIEAEGLLPPGIYAYRIVARHVVGNGTIARSTASAEVTADATRPDNSVRIHWDPVPGATEYLVYGRTAGAETTFWKVTTTEFVDTGEAGSPGAVPTTAGTRWVVKNLFELKAGRNVVVESNIFENNWLNGQNGYAVVLTPRNSGGCPWCVVEDVSFRYNLVRNTASGFNLLGYDNSGVTKQTNNIRIAHNVIVLSTTLGGQGWFVQMGDEPRDVKLCHNTIDSNGTTVVYVYGGTATDPREVLGFEYAGNAARHNNYGMNGGFFTFGNAILNAWYPGYKWEANYLAGASASKYPAGTLVISPFENQFVDTAAGDYTVRAGSLLQGAGPTTAGLCGGDADIVPHPDIGADHGTLTARVANVRAAAPANVPTPPTAAVSVTCTYLDCAFSDQSAEGSAALARRSWRFGDGTESTDAAGTHTYGAAGTYTVRLIVWDANDLSDTYTTTVKVRPPNVAPTASFRSSCVDLVCTFTDTSVDPDGPIVAWAWTFGSSGTSTDAAPTFRFPGPGSYDVSLTVTDSDGATATKTAAVQITGILHVSFVDAVITSGKNGKGTPHWAVSATVEAHGADERVIPGATLSVTWDGVRTSSCITSSDGRCTFNSGALSAKQTSVTLTVLGVSAASSVYQPPANHDPAGNATGMSMTYVKP
jgi:PKD repeat protein